MQPLSMLAYIVHRLLADRNLLLSIFAGITIATTLIAGAPVYLDSLERQGLHTAIDRSPDDQLSILTYAPHIPLARSSLSDTEKSFVDAMRLHIPEIYRGHERYLKSRNYLLAFPGRLSFDGSGEAASEGYFQHLSNLEQHVTFLEGRMATDAVSFGPRGPLVEAVLSAISARISGLGVGDTVILTTTVTDPTRISAQIVGVLEPANPREEYWQHFINIFNEPEGEGLFITREAMIEGLGKAYPRTNVISTWSVLVDKEALKGWPTSDGRDRLTALENDLSIVMQGSTVVTGISRLLDNFERRSFFSRVPLLLLLSIMLMTVLYYLFMMVSYLVQSRENEGRSAQEPWSQHPAAAEAVLSGGRDIDGGGGSRGPFSRDGGRGDGGQATVFRRDNRRRYAAGAISLGAVCSCGRHRPVKPGYIHHSGPGRGQERPGYTQAALLATSLGALLPEIQPRHGATHRGRTRFLGAAG